ncbi:MAG: cytidine deaminase [Thermovirgaceae bacterium]|nr:cytidine deaminase [Synergistales bacterium]HPC75792.1 cytidine deaminase [Synergistales bacterium]HRS48545.1 cytidine deaminase [Thermovirgaceae bacterium]HRU90692.1 cytidine deaminase [Thermovirgaceae bacterium]
MKDSTGRGPLKKEELEALMEQARGAREKAYAPYSGFTVGAAVLSGSGEVFLAGNLENASYGLSVCAERNAITLMVASGRRDPVAMAIAGPEGVPCPPCGACRQVLAEFNPAMAIILEDGAGGFEVLSLEYLFPRPFRL